MSRLEDLIQTLCPDGVDFVELGVIVDILDSQRKPVTKSDRKPGPYPYYGANGIQDYVAGYIFDGTFLLVGEDGSVINPDGSPILTWATGKIWVNNHAHVLAEKNNWALLRYLYYYLQTVDVSKVVRGVPPKINQENLRKISVALPPKEVQEEIVRILDTFSGVVTELEQKLEAEQAARVRQYEHYRNTLFEPNQQSTQKTLGDIGRVCMCRRIFKEQTDTSGDVPFYKIGTFGKEPDAYITKELFEEYKSKFSYPKKGAILFSAAGTIGRTVIFDGEPAYFQDSNIVWIDNDETLVLNKYLFYFFSLGKWATSEGGTIARLYNYNISKTRISVPPLEVQEEIVSILDCFDTLVNDLKSGLPAEIALRRKQYETYRDKLLTFQPVK